MAVQEIGWQADNEGCVTDRYRCDYKGCGKLFVGRGALGTHKVRALVDMERLNHNNIMLSGTAQLRSVNIAWRPVHRGGTFGRRRRVARLGGQEVRPRRCASKQKVQVRHLSTCMSVAITESFVDSVGVGLSSVPALFGAVVRCRPIRKSAHMAIRNLRRALKMNQCGHCLRRVELDATVENLVRCYNFENDDIAPLLP